MKSKSKNHTIYDGPGPVAFSIIMLLLVTVIVAVWLVVASLFMELNTWVYVAFGATTLLWLLWLLIITDSLNRKEKEKKVF